MIKESDFELHFAQKTTYLLNHHADLICNEQSISRTT